MNTQLPSPPFRGEREGPAPQAWEGEVGVGTAGVPPALPARCRRSQVGRCGISHLTPTLSAPGDPRDGEGMSALPVGSPSSIGDRWSIASVFDDDSSG
jgi:hypothetical protein